MLFIRYDQSDSSELTFQLRSRCKLISGSDILSLSVSDENSVDDDQVPSSAFSRSKQPQARHVKGVHFLSRKSSFLQLHVEHFFSLFLQEHPLTISTGLE